MFFSSFAVTIVHIEFEFIEFIEQGQSFKNVQVSQKLRLHFYFHKILFIFFDFYNVKEREHKPNTVVSCTQLWVCTQHAYSTFLLN